MKRITLICALIGCVLGVLGNANAQVVSFCKIDTDSQKPGWQPFPLNQVPEASNGFRLPVGFTPSTSGFTFNFDTRQDPSHPAYPDCTAGGWVYHPGWDMNYPSYSDYEYDNNLPFYAAATGRVVWIGPGTLRTSASGARERVMDQGGWASIVIQHNYQGITYFTQYGHARAVNGNLNCGDTVQKDWFIGWIGRTGTKTSHLHYEIRKGNHPDPIKGGYFCDRLPWDTTKYALQAINAGAGQTYVSEWYENPNGFHDSHRGFAENRMYLEYSKPEVYLNVAGGKLWVRTEADVIYWGGWNAILAVSDGALQTPRNGKLPFEGTMVRERSRPEVFLVKNGKLCHLLSEQQVISYGGWAAIRVVPDFSLAVEFFPRGCN